VDAIALSRAQPTPCLGRAKDEPADVHIPALIDVAKIPELCELSIGDKRARRRTRSLGRLECRQLVRRLQTAWIKQDL
jgi:hypothetical protein